MDTRLSTISGGRTRWQYSTHTHSLKAVKSRSRIRSNNQSRLPLTIPTRAGSLEISLSSDIYPSDIKVVFQLCFRQFCSSTNIIMLFIATLTVILSTSTNHAFALPATPQVYLGDKPRAPGWALAANPPRLNENIQSTITTLPIRLGRPFIVPVDHKGRPTGMPSVPSELSVIA